MYVGNFENILPSIIWPALSYFVSNLFCLHRLHSVDIQNKVFDMGSALVFLQSWSILWFQLEPAIAFLQILFKHHWFSYFDHLVLKESDANIEIALPPGECEDIKNISMFLFWNHSLYVSRVSISCTDLTSLRIALYNNLTSLRIALYYRQNNLFCHNVPSNRPSLAHNE